MGVGGVGEGALERVQGFVRHKNDTANERSGTVGIDGYGARKKGERIKKSFTPQSLNTGVCDEDESSE
jgi:hypothetical protein